MDKTIKLWLGRSLLLMVILVVALAYFYVADSELRELVRPHECLFSQATGLLCPACGGTRAMIHLLNGNILLAMKSNVLAVFTMPLIFYAAWTASRLAFDQRFTPADIRIAPFLVWSYLALVILFWIARNFAWLSILRPPG